MYLITLTEIAFSSKNYFTQKPKTNVVQSYSRRLMRLITVKICPESWSEAFVEISPSANDPLYSNPKRLLVSRTETVLKIET